MMNTFEHNRNILKSINSFNLLEKARYEALRDTRQIKFSNPLPKQKYHKIIENDKMNNPYRDVIEPPNPVRDSEVQ